MGGVFSTSTRETTADATNAGVYLDGGATVDTKIDCGYTVNYISCSGATIAIPSAVNPYEILNVRNGTSFFEVKRRFFEVVNSANRQSRARVSLAYHMVTCKKDTRYRKSGEDLFVIAVPDVFLLSVVGDTTALISFIKKNSALLRCTDEHGHTVLYLAARSGYCDTSLELLKAGASVNVQQVDGSTPLHGAAFYGQKDVVEMLLEYGADQTIKNRFGCTPVDDARDESIKQVFRKFANDNLFQIVCPILAGKHASNLQLLYHQGRTIAKVLHRIVNQETLARIQEWEVAWHGTKAQYLKPIFQYDMQPSGTKLPDGRTIKPPAGHIPLGCSYDNINNWSQAIFVSPSILYAVHAAYAEYISSESKRWAILVKVKVKPGSYTKHGPTLSPPHHHVPDEPKDSEYRISCDTTELPIMRVEHYKNTVAVAAVFVQLSFLESAHRQDITYADIVKLFA